MSSQAKSPISDASMEALLLRCEEEFRSFGRRLFQLDIGFPSMICLIANVQLGLRHPGATGPGSQTARQLVKLMIDMMRESGFIANAELAELGFNPDWDMEREPPPVSTAGLNKIAEADLLLSEIIAATETVGSDWGRPDVAEKAQRVRGLIAVCSRCV